MIIDRKQQAAELENQARRDEANAEVLARRGDEPRATQLREHAKQLRSRASQLRGARPPVRFG